MSEWLKGNQKSCWHSKQSGAKSRGLNYFSPRKGGEDVEEKVCIRETVSPGEFNIFLHDSEALGRRQP